MSDKTTIIIIAIATVAFLIAAIVGRLYSPISRSAVYEVPMAKGANWKVTVYQNKPYALIELPAMPEGGK